MRPAAFFPELRLGDHDFPAYSPGATALDESKPVVRAAADDADRPERTNRPRHVRRRREMPSCVLEA